MPKEHTQYTVSKATSRSVNKSAISTIVVIILTAVIVGSVAVGATYAYFALQSAPAQQLVTQPKPALQKFKAYGYSPTTDAIFLIIDAGTERGIWANNGLAPEWVYSSGVPAFALKELVSSGVKIGLSSTNDVLIARSNGVPIKIVGCFNGNDRGNRIYVKADGPIKSMKDLDGKKIGVGPPNGAYHRVALYISDKVGIKPEFVYGLTNSSIGVAALKVGRIDAFSGYGIAILRLVDSGELRIVAELSDYRPKPTASGCMFAAEDLIEQNPDLVKRFVKATLESVGYLKENPSYAADLYIKKTNAPRDLAEKVKTAQDWSPSGRGSGVDLIAAARNLWQYLKDTGAVPADANLKIEEAVDVRFLP